MSSRFSSSYCLTKLHLHSFQLIFWCLLSDFRQINQAVNKGWMDAKDLLYWLYKVRSSSEVKICPGGCRYTMTTSHHLDFFICLKTYCSLIWACAVVRIFLKTAVYSTQSKIVLIKRHQVQILCLILCFYATIPPISHIYYLI